MKRIFIKNGRVIDPKNKRDEEIGIVVENGKIKDYLSSNKKVDDAEIVDAQGLVVAPGFVDLHVHFREPGFEYKETIETGTKAAAAGGFTSVCCMANTSPVNDNASVTDFIIQKAKEKGIVNVYPIGALTKDLAGKELAEIGSLKEAGCVALSDDGKAVENNMVMRLAMSYAKSFDLPVITHSIDPCLGCGVMNEGTISTRLGLSGIPNEAEDIMISRDIHLAKLTGAKLHVAHLSTTGGAELVAWAKKRGLPITAEVTPHHIALNDEAVIGYNTNAKMAPPLRSEADRKAMLEALYNGTIDCIATDHAPHAIIDKEVEFDVASCGLVGLETALAVSLRAINLKKFSLSQLIASLTYKAAEVVNLKKGSLEVGSDADIVLFNPDEEWVVDSSKFFSKSHNTPFDGMKVKGSIARTYVGGRLVYKRK